MLNVYEQVDRNKRRSLIVMAWFFVFIIIVAWAFTKLFEFGPGVILVACLFALLSSFASYWWGDKLILATMRARPANRSSEFHFFTCAQNLSMVAQIPQPKLYVIDDPSLNAFATGRDPKNAVVCVTKGLLESLDRTELEGVIAHEFAHIKGYDTRLMTIVGVLVGMVILLSNWVFRASLYGGGRGGRRGGGMLQALLFLLAVLTIILSPIIAQIVQLAISRRREFLADAQAVMMTRFPEGLARALEKLSQASSSLKVASGATAHLFIVNPLKKGKLNGFMAHLFSTHPSIEERIKTLRAM